MLACSGKGLELVSPSVDYAVKRLVIELDYASDAPELVRCVVMCVVMYVLGM